MRRPWWPGWGAVFASAVVVAIGSAGFALVPMLWEDNGWPGALERAGWAAGGISTVSVAEYLAMVRKERRAERRGEQAVTAASEEAGE